MLVGTTNAYFATDLNTRLFDFDIKYNVSRKTLSDVRVGLPVPVCEIRKENHNSV